MNAPTAKRASRRNCSVRLRRHRPSSRKYLSAAAFTLLEVILALAILGGSIAVIGEVMRLGMQNSQIARDVTYAQFLCETKLSEIVTQAAPLESATQVAFPDDPDWTYTIETESIDDALLAVYVTVAPLDAEVGSRREFTLTRWMRDPQVVLQEEQTAADLQAEAAAAAAATTQPSAGGGVRQ